MGKIRGIFNLNLDPNVLRNDLNLKVTAKSRINYHAYKCHC